MASFEGTIFEYLENLKRTLAVKPLVLGGVSGPGGGSGAPVGGFIGKLPQTSVTFDTDELEDLTIPASGESLLHNLNRIRYRIKAVEDAIGVSAGMITVLHEGDELLNNVTELDFYGDINLISVSGNPTSRVVVELPKHTFNEILTPQISGYVFYTEFPYVSGTLCLYYNGIRELKSNYTEYPEDGMLELNFLPVSGEILVVDYLYYALAVAGWGKGWGNFRW